MLKRIFFFVLAVVLLPVLCGFVRANPTNLLSNGSFEDGGGTLNGWTVSDINTGYPIAVILTDGLTGSAFGEVVPVDYISGGSPDAAGTHGVYFVDDHATQVLSQSVFLNAGSYEIGFDEYSPRNGFGNGGDASFTGTIAGVTLANFTVHGQNDPGEWIHFSGIANVSVSGFYGAAFDFQTFGGASADVVIDRVYIVSSDSGGGTPIPPATVPEPTSLLLLGTGLGVIGVAAWRKRK